MNGAVSGCNIACDGCSGPGYDKCVECTDGYLRNATECVGKLGVKCDTQASKMGSLERAHLRVNTARVCESCSSLLVLQA